MSEADRSGRDWRACVVVALARMTDGYVAPTILAMAFNCPSCLAYAHQRWAPEVVVRLPIAGGHEKVFLSSMHVSMCSHCQRHATWIDGQLIHPPSLVAPPPSSDLEGAALASYEEARGVLASSSRAAAAILRLCIQQLVSQLGATNENLNTAIGELVALGLPTKVQQALDAVRVIGNDAVHPGQIDVNDDPALAVSLFGLVNIIVETMITQPRAVEALYRALPQTKLEQIERRDSAGE